MILHCIVIPCFNEESRFPLSKFYDFLASQNNKNIFFCFVNDGSNDNTLNILKKIHLEFPNNTLIINQKENKGKAMAVFNGVTTAMEWKEFDYIGYLDCDLATPIEEYLRIGSFMNNDITFTFGSRIRRIGSHIHRKLYRHIIGRIFATLSSNILDLPVYDTQCGAKCFSYEVAKNIFKQPFISNWSFDIEIFFRFIILVGKENVDTKAKEIPLEQWNDIGESKVKLSYALKLPFELLRIKKYYKNYK